VVSVEEELDLVFAPLDEQDDFDEDGIRPLPQGTMDLDLGEAIREEVILSQTLLALCKPDCRGLCPHCGINLNEKRCDCSRDEPDPRWDVLRALREE
jgi:uncharacterized protein